MRRSNSEIAKPKEIPNLVAKTDVVYEEPGQDKSMLSRMVDKINPFAASDDKKPAATEAESALDLLAKKKASEKARIARFAFQPMAIRRRQSQD